MRRIGTLATVTLLVALIGAGIAVGASQEDPLPSGHVPITGLDQRVYRYPRGVLQACGPLVDAGQEPYVFGQEPIRWEPDVFGNGPLPTEHWQTRLQVRRVEGRKRTLLFSEVYSHQNHRPGKLKPEIGQWNLYPSMLGPGVYDLTVQVTGDESGVRYRDTCTITVTG